MDGRGYTLQVDYAWNIKITSMQDTNNITTTFMTFITMKLPV